MLQHKAVVQEMIDIIKEMQSHSLFKDHVLVGGTALALQLGHRTSTDIDLFSKKVQNSESIIDYVKTKYKDNTILIANNDFIRIIVNEIKIEMVHYEGKTLEDAKEEDGIRFYGIKDIAVMKLEAMLKRTEPRDFIDFAYILNEMPLEDIFENYKKIFETISPLFIKRTLLTKSKNIKNNEWLVGGIKMLRHDIDVKEVPSIIEKAIARYNAKINIGK